MAWKSQIAEDMGGNMAAAPAALPRPALSPYEIAVFCNVLGVAPRRLTRAREAITERYDLGPRGAWIIGLLEIGVNSPTGLTEALQIGRSLVTAEIGRLAIAGLVSATPSDRDGRRTILKLTAEGRKVSRELRETINTFVLERLAGYSREQVIAAIALLRDFVSGDSIGTLEE